MGGHILKAELADVKGKECEGLIRSISFVSNYVLVLGEQRWVCCLLLSLMSFHDPW